MNGYKVDCESYTIRRVASIEELKETFDVLGAQFTRPVADEDRVFTDLLDHYPQDRQLMLVAAKDGQIVGGALG